MTTVAMVLVALVPIAVMASGADLAAFQKVMQDFGFLIVLGFVGLCYLPFLFRKKNVGRIRLQDGRLRFEGPDGCSEFYLDDARLSLSRVSVHGNFLGTLFTAHSPHTGETARLFSGGAELSPRAYDGGEATYGNDAWSMHRRDFRELLGELEGFGALEPVDRVAVPAHAARPAGASSPRGPDAERPARAEEETFEATSPPSVGWFFGLAFLPFLVMVGVVAAMNVPWATAPLQGLVVVGVIAALAAGPAYLLARGLRTRGRGRIFLRISRHGLVLAGAKGELFRAAMPPRVVVLTWRNHWVHRHRYTLGYAARLTNQRGETITLGIADPFSAEPGADKTSNVDYVISADAGQALLRRVSEPSR